jgi:hypothetical protein
MPLVNNTSHKFAASVNDIGGKLPPETTTLAVNLHFTLSPVNKHSRKPRPKEVKRAALKLWKAKVPLDSIRKQFNMPERSLHKILAHEKQNPGGTFLDKKNSPGQRLHQEAAGKHAQKASGAD